MIWKLKSLILIYQHFVDGTICLSKYRKKILNVTLHKFNNFDKAIIKYYNYFSERILAQKKIPQKPLV